VSKRVGFIVQLTGLILAIVLAGPPVVLQSSEAPEDAGQPKEIRHTSVEAHRQEVNDTYSQLRGEPGEWPSDKVIYGADNRQDIYEVTDPNILKLAQAACVVVDISEITDNGNGTYTLSTSAWTSVSGLPLCSGEPFAGQLQIGFCSGYLVGEDVLVTAGHCVSSSDCGYTAFVFGFTQIDATTPPLTVVPEDNVYFCSEIINQQLAGDNDHSVIRLDRPVVGRDPLPIRRTGSVSDGDSIIVVGHPVVLPMKASDGAIVQNANGSIPWFQANLDTYGGNSGSLVANTTDWTVEGILVRGAPDFVDAGGCAESNRVPDTGNEGSGLEFEEVTKTTSFSQYVPALMSHAGTVEFDQDYYRCEDLAGVTVRDSGLVGAGTQNVLVTSSTGDSETLTLTETPPNSGKLVGTIATAEEAVTTEDGTLQVTHGATITAQYDDADDGTGSPATVYDNAGIDCLDYFTEIFEADDNDLNNQTLKFIPDGSADYYAACREATSVFPTDPSGGTVLSLGDDDYEQVTLAGGAQVSLYGVSYSSFYVGSNGYITFGFSDTDLSESLEDHFDLPRISGLFDDLNPSSAGTVSWKQLSDRAVVTYEDVTEYSPTSQNSFQIEMFFDGVITITHLTIEATDGLAGLSEGNGLPPVFVESDLSSYGPCVSSAGQVRFDAAVYDCDDVAGVEMTDIDLLAFPTYDVTVTSDGGDSETLTLTQTPFASGVFIGSVPVAAGTVVTENGTVEVSHGEEITVTYNDADDGTGSPAVVTDVAAIDCAPPVISNVAVTNILSVEATVTFDTDEPASSVIHYGTDCGDLSLSANGPTATAHSVVLSALSPLTTYYFSIEVTDGEGNSVTDDNGGLCYSFATPDQPDYFTELFTAKSTGDESKGTELNKGSYDMSNTTLTYSPDGSFDFYDLCLSPATGFPTDPAGGTALALGDDDYEQVTLSGGSVSLYGTSYTDFYVGSNGYITFTEGDTDLSEFLDDHFDLPRISGLFDDLSPNQAGTVTWKELPDRVAVTWEDVTEYNAADQNSFQIEMYFDGTIVVTYLGIAAQDGLIGLSAGLGTPPDFVMSDMSGYPSCCDCPNQADIEPDGFITPLDLAAAIDILFASGEDVRDGSCPSPRFDLDCDDFTTPLDLAKIIDHLFASGEGPCDPCVP
jgi:hypothetical protein